MKFHSEDLIAGERLERRHEERSTSDGLGEGHEPASL